MVSIVCLKINHSLSHCGMSKPSFPFFIVPKALAEFHPELASTQYLLHAKPWGEDRHPFSSDLQPSREGSYQAGNEICNERGQAEQMQSAPEAADYDRSPEAGTLG